MSEQQTQASGTAAGAAQAQQQTQTTQQTQAAGSTTATEQKASTEQTSTTQTTEQQAAGEAFEIKLPEGAKIDPKAVETFKAMAKEHGIPAKAAQALVDFQLSQVAAQEAAYKAALEKQRVADLESVKADKEFGGPKYEATVKGARSAVKQFGGEHLSKLYESLGIENHPEVVKAWARVSAAVAEDTVAGTGGDTANIDPVAELKSLFPNSPQMFQR